MVAVRDSQLKSSQQEHRQCSYPRYGERTWPGRQSVPTGFDCLLLSLLCFRDPIEYFAEKTASFGKRFSSVRYCCLIIDQIWLPSIMIAWGVVTLCTGFVQNYTGLLIVRIFLGVGEAGLFPGVAFYLTFWYDQTPVTSLSACVITKLTGRVQVRA